MLEGYVGFKLFSQFGFDDSWFEIGKFDDGGKSSVFLVSSVCYKCWGVVDQLGIEKFHNCGGGSSW